MAETFAPTMVPVAIPKKLATAFATAVRQGFTGNFIIHLRIGEVAGLTYERKETYNDFDRKDTIALG